MPLRPLQAKPFSFAAAENGIGLGPRSRHGRCRRNHSPSWQRRLESDAERCCGRDRCHSGGFLLRIMPPSWHPVPACAPRLCCRRAIPHYSGDGAASIPKSGPEIKNRFTQVAVNRENLALIRKFGLEIKNRCTQEGLNGEKLTSIRKFGLEIKNRCMQQTIFSMRSLDEPLWRYVGGNLHQRWFDSGG